jgi:hypothetical protein
MLHGYSIGDSTVDIGLHATHDAHGNKGFEGQAHIADLNLNGIHYTSVTLTVSTLVNHARFEAHMRTSKGNFSVEADVSKPHSHVQVTLNVTGADLAFQTQTVKFRHISGTLETSFPSGDGCSTVSGTLTGVFEMKGAVYDPIRVHVAVDCGKLSKFEFHIHVSHTGADGVTTAADMKIALHNKAGFAGDLSPEGSTLGSTEGNTGVIEYKSALLGYADLSKSRAFSRKFQGKRFSREVTIGLVFGLAVYQPRGSSHWHSMVGAGGYFNADRVSGSFGCALSSANFTPDDFSCEGRLRINPRWAGVYRFGWGSI